MTVNELAGMARCPIEVKSGYNGKILCRGYNGKKHVSVADREVTSIWTEIRVTNGGGFSSFARPIICVYVSGEKEAAQAGEGGE
jgi:hypothetical protein